MPKSQSNILNNTNFTGNIGVNDLVCYECYKAQLVLIKQTESVTQSLDEDLIEVLKEIRCHIQNSISSDDQALTHAISQSSLLVGEALLEQNPILLPEVWDFFEQTYLHNIKVNDLCPKYQLSQIANPTWLLSQLSLNLQQHMAYKCTVKRYGTVLYRYGGNLLHALNVSLGKARTKSLMSLGISILTYLKK